MNLLHSVVQPDTCPAPAPLVPRIAGRGHPALRRLLHQLPQQDPAQLRAEVGAGEHAPAQRQWQVLRVHAQGRDQLTRDPQRGAERHAAQGTDPSPSERVRGRVSERVSE